MSLCLVRFTSVIHSAGGFDAPTLKYDPLGSSGLTPVHLTSSDVIPGVWGACNVQRIVFVEIFPPLFCLSLSLMNVLIDSSVVATDHVHFSPCANISTLGK